MKISTKVVLLSALVFPGAGHLYLKKYFVGFLLSGITLLAIYMISSSVFDSAMSIVDQIQSGNVSPDIATISELVSNSAIHSQTVNIATLALLIVWLTGIFDSYRIGHSQGKL